MITILFGILGNARCLYCGKKLRKCRCGYGS